MSDGGPECAGGVGMSVIGAAFTHSGLSLITAAERFVYHTEIRPHIGRVSARARLFVHFKLAKERIYVCVCVCFPVCCELSLTPNSLSLIGCVILGEDKEGH